jgi:DUF971 family protein
VSFWDSVKPAKKPPVAVTVAVTPDQLGLTVTWDDGHVSKISAQLLRQECPCAGCVEEFTGKQTLDPSTVSAGTRVLEVSPVGNYALSFVFSDAHRTGIYNWPHLRRLG